MSIHGIPLRRGLRLIGIGLARKARGNRRYDGTAAQICEQIVRGCFDPQRRYLMTSHTTYAEFWSRDFGRCVPALLGLGFEREVGDTLHYALERYAQAGRYALVIDPSGKLLDFPAYAPDGFAFLLSALVALNDTSLVRRHRGLLQRELHRFVSLVISPASGLVRQDAHFSEAQDYVIRRSSCYSNTMCFIVQRCADALGLDSPLARYDYHKLVLEHFWRGDHFSDDLTNAPHVAGDAAILPFWSGLLGYGDAAAERFQRVLARMDREGLNSPYPTRYGNSAQLDRPMIALERFNRWQRDAVWPCLGLHLLQVLQKFDKRRLRIELDRYSQLVERLGCFPEVICPRSEDLFEGPFYRGDDSMLWAADFWWLLRSQGPA